MSEFYIQLFGKFDLKNCNRIPIELESRHLRELLAYLLVFRAKPRPRETLAALFWGDFDTNRAHKYLRQSLWQLQKALACEHHAPLLQIDDEWVQVHPQADYWLDVADFEAGWAAHCAAPNLPELSGLPALAPLVELYRGDLLDGCYADWCLFERERLQNLDLLLLLKLADYCLLHAAYERGIDYATQVLRVYPAHERAHCQLMQFYDRMGNRSEALRQYTRCARALQADLGIQPSRATQALYAQIRGDVAPDEPSLPEASRHRLAAWCASLEELQHQISGEIQSIRQALKK